MDKKTPPLHHTSAKETNAVFLKKSLKYFHAIVLMNNNVS